MHQKQTSISLFYTVAYTRSLSLLFAKGLHWAGNRSELLINMNKRIKEFDVAFKYSSSKASFNEGDWLFLILQPYKQMSLMNTKKDNKLSTKYYVPYKMLQNIGSMAYKLELPAYLLG